MFGIFMHQTQLITLRWLQFMSSISKWQMNLLQFILMAVQRVCPRHARPNDPVCLESNRWHKYCDDDEDDEDDLENSLLVQRSNKNARGNMEHCENLFGFISQLSLRGSRQLRSLWRKRLRARDPSARACHDQLWRCRIPHISTEEKAGRGRKITKLPSKI